MKEITGPEIEDYDNVRDVVMHYCGPPETGEELAKYEGLLEDLLRYCTRLRNQPTLREHLPKHELIRYT